MDKLEAELAELLKENSSLDETNAALEAEVAKAEADQREHIANIIEECQAALVSKREKKRKLEKDLDEIKNKKVM